MRVTRSTQGIPILMVLLAVLSLPDAASAAGRVDVLINGQQMSNTACPTPPAPCTVVISNSPSDASAKDYGDFKIQGADGTNPAVVRAVDAASDTLELTNVTVVADVAGATSQIDYWAEFSEADNIPSAPPSNSVRYQRSANGSLTRGNQAARDSWYEVAGYVNTTNLICCVERKTVCSPFTPCRFLQYGAIDLAADPELFLTSHTGVREILTESSFYLKLAGDRLNLDLVQIQSTPINAVPPKAPAHSGVTKTREGRGRCGCDCACTGPRRSRGGE